MKTATIPLATCLALAALAALAAQATLMATEPVAADPAREKPAAEAQAKAAEEDGIRLPPGFREVKRGKHTLYCRKETPLGTRFKSETCYDEDNMRAYILALEQTKGDVDRIRSTCANVCVCGGNC